MEPKKVKIEKTDTILSWLKKSRARSMELPTVAYERMEAMKALANNRAVTTLDLNDCEVRLFTIALVIHAIIREHV
jgi:hypothetical protein